MPNHEVPTMSKTLTIFIKSKWLFLQTSGASSSKMLPSMLKMLKADPPVIESTSTYGRDDLCTNLVIPH